MPKQIFLERVRREAARCLRDGHPIDRVQALATAALAAVRSLDDDDELPPATLEQLSRDFSDLPLTLASDFAQPETAAQEASVIRLRSAIQGTH